ncbi:hypothetical protein [Shimia sp.]|uniref:hypothetical protein n=1 Tax=Shimia sp. TaxID=1954381 RepID=UPI003BAB2ED3
MVTNNKVLTVSYGTFSCTLEGFEESFDTMKAIAEYFRDLAADDRYFGAEPPTPDAEMLARIAEKEIARRVSARMDQGTIVLSTNAPQAAEAPAPVQAPAPTPVAEAPIAAPAPAAPAAAAPVQAPVEAPAPAPVAEAPAPALVEPEPEDIVAAEEIAVVAEAEAAPIAEDAPQKDVIEAEAAPSVTDSVLAAIADDTLDTPATDDANAFIEDTPEDAAEETPINLGAIAAAVNADVVEEDLAEETAAETVEEPSVAEDVVEEAAELAEEDTVETAVEDTAEDLAEALTEEVAEEADALDISEEADAPLILENAVEDTVDPFATEAEEAPEALADAEVSEDTEAADLSDWDEDEADSAAYEENSIAAKLERIRAVVSRADSAKADAIPMEADAEEDGEAAADSNIFEEEDAALYQDVAPVEQAAAEETADAPISEDVLSEDDFTAVTEAVAEADPQIEDDAPEAEDKIAAEATEEAELAEEAEAQPLRARVVRMKKADFEEAVAAGLLEAEPVDEDEEETAEAAPTSSLTPEDEADLLSELAKVQAELKAADAVADAAPEKEENLFAEDLSEDTAAEAEEEAAAPAPERPQQPEPDLSRLMAKADSEMQEPAGKGRRSAIAHLRAAVAATRAEKHAVANKSKDGTTAYRSDLASVVRAATGGAKSAAAPLKLVAAQRVDTPAEAEEKSAQPESTAPKKAPRRIPVRPRRISADQVDREEAARAAAPVSSGSSAMSGFLDYAKSVGATQLPESVEAAAAYLTYVEGLDRFTRPMLMRMAREVNIPQFSREEGLRSFGQLLRQQKIDKLAGGRFTANQAINFQPRDREAG